MTHLEFEQEFDILYNSIASNLAPSVDIYEMSVFLTKALEEVVALLYSSFEEREANWIYLRELLVQTSIINTPATTTLDILPSNSLIQNLLYAVRELVKVSTPCERYITVSPITLDEYNKVSGNPFRGTSLRRAIRVEENGHLRIESKIPFSEYKLDYIRKPNPIILATLNPLPSSSGLLQTLTIDGEYLLQSYDPLHTGTANLACELHPILHRTILERAVMLAKQAYLGTTES